MSVLEPVRTLIVRHRAPGSRLARRITLAATVLFLLVVCNWRPWQLFARGGFSTDFYDAQAHAFWRLQLHVPAEVAGPEGFLIGGKTYLYYGPLLALARMPAALLGHSLDGRLSRLSMVLAFFTACTLTFHLAENVRRMLSPGVAATPRRHAVLVAAVAVSPALYLAGWNSVYDETELWAFAFFLATAVALLRCWQSPDRRGVGLACGAAIAAVLTRASVGLGALTAVALVGVLLWRRDRRLAGLAVGGAVAGVALNMAVNLAKFGTLLDLPADRQLLTLRNAERAAWFAGNDGSFFSPRFLPTTVVQYLRPDTVRFERLLPFVRFGPLATEHGSYPLEGNTPASSLPTSATLLVVLALAGVWIVVSRRSWPLLALFAGAIVAAAPSFLIGFVANRYLTDMLPMLVVPAAAATAAIPVRSGGGGRALRWLVGALVVWGLWVNVSLATWTQSLKLPGFTELRYRVDDVVFGGAPPSVIDLVAGEPSPRDGVVAIDGDCDGLYIAEQGSWVPLELAKGVRRILATAATVDNDVGLDGPDGRLHISVSGMVVRASFAPVDGEVIEGPPVPVDGSTMQIEVSSDPVTRAFAVIIDGHDALFAFSAPTLTEVTPVGGLQLVEPAGRGTPICDALQARR